MAAIVTLHFDDIRQRSPVDFTLRASYLLRGSLNFFFFVLVLVFANTWHRSVSPTTLLFPRLFNLLFLELKQVSSELLNLHEIAPRINLESVAGDPLLN